MTRIDRVPLVLLAITTLFTVVMVPLSVGQEEAFDTVLYTFLPMSLAITGALIATREPANPIGWIFCALGVGGALTEIGEGYGYLAADHGLKGGAAGEWFSSWSWLTDMLGWTLLLLIFPGGRLPSPRWRWTVAAAGTGCGLAILGQALSSDSGDQFSSGANPLAVDSPVIGVAFLLGGAILITALLAAVISAIGRFRRATGVERQQLKWFVYDARGTLESFSARLRNQVDLAALDGELTTAVRQTLAPTRVALWLRPSDPAR